MPDSLPLIANNFKIIQVLSLFVLKLCKSMTCLLYNPCSVWFGGAPNPPNPHYPQSTTMVFVVWARPTSALNAPDEKQVHSHWAHTGWINIVSTSFQWNDVEIMWNARWRLCPVGCDPKYWSLSSFSSFSSQSPIVSLVHWYSWYSPQNVLHVSNQVFKIYHFQNTEIQLAWCHALILVIYVLCIILVRSGCDEGGCVFCLIFFYIYGVFVCLGICRSMVAWIGSQSETAVFRCHFLGTFFRYQYSFGYLGGFCLCVVACLHSFCIA